MSGYILPLKTIPRNCALCPLSSFKKFYGDIICTVSDYRVNKTFAKRPDWCPIKEIPQNLEWLIYEE